MRNPQTLKVDFNDDLLLRVYYSIALHVANKE